MQAQTRRARPILIVGLAGIFLVGALAFRPVRQLLFRGVTSVSQPISRGSLAVLRSFGWSSALRQTPNATLELEQQLAAVSRQLSEASQELQSRQTADQLAAYLGKVSYPTVPAAVIGYSPDPGIQSLVINVGKNKNVKIGEPVMTGDGWMIGKILTVHEATSVVLLLTDAQSLALASIQNATVSQGVVRGERGLAIRMDLIPKNDTIVIGQSVVTSGLEPGIPPDLLLGTISNIEQRSGEVFQRARLNVPIRYGRVRQVAVITQ